MAKQSSKTSETKTENIFRCYYGADTFIEKSAIPTQCGFKSKNNTGAIGYPDFYREEDDYAIIVEAKGTDYDSAVNEVKFYAEYNDIKKDIITIAIAGQTEKTYKAGFFIKLYEGQYHKLETDGKLMSLNDINKIYRKYKYGDSVTTESLKKSLTNLNKIFHDKMKIKDTERSLFFAGLMIALKDETFIRTYRDIASPSATSRKQHKLLEAHNLNEAIVSAITTQISTKVNNHSKEYNWRDRFSFIMTIDYPLNDYKKIISTIEKEIFHPFKNDEKQDVLGRAYKIFLSRVAGGIENKNIILTPEHIKTLMVELARLDVKDVVLDTCTGSGGFLMEAMEVMIKQAKNSSETITKIREERLIGFEIDATLFALACSNMFLHGDGRTNLIYGSSLFNEESETDMETLNAIKSLHPTKCIINPPYEKNNPILFTKQALELLEPNGKLIIIMPTPTLNRNIGGLTDEILEMAKLDFVIKMPNNLFSEQKRTVNTSIFGFTKTPHNESDSVIFYNMEEDGFVSVQHKGRVDKRGAWKNIHDDVVNTILYSRNTDADYERRLIYKDGILNCYGYKSPRAESNREMVKFSELFKVQKGSLASENCDEDGEYDFITASEEWKKHSTYDNDCEALIYAVSAGGSLGRSHYVNGKFIASNLCLVLTPKNPEAYPINLQFYNYYLNHIRKEIVRDIADGTSKLTINHKDLSDYYVNYYPIEEQNRIIGVYNSDVKPIIDKYEKALRTFDTKLSKIL